MRSSVAATAAAQSAARVAVVADPADRDQPVGEARPRASGRASRSAARSDRARRCGAVADTDEAGDALEDLPGAQPGHRHQPVGDDGAADRRPGVDEWRARSPASTGAAHGDRDRVSRAQRLEQAAGLDRRRRRRRPPGGRGRRRRGGRRRSVRTMPLPAPATPNAGRRAGTSGRRRETRGRPATTSPVCRSHSPVRPARLISACWSPPSEWTTHSATLSQRTPAPRRSSSGSLKIVASGSNADAGAGRRDRGAPWRSARRHRAGRTRR